MHDLTEKAQEVLCRTAKQVESFVSEHPISIPVVIVDGVLPDIPRGIGEPTIARRKAFQIVKATQEFDVIELPLPMDAFKPHAVHDVLPDIFA